jgi:hypothetical protein
MEQFSKPQKIAIGIWLVAFVVGVIATITGLWQLYIIALLTVIGSLVYLHRAAKKEDRKWWQLLLDIVGLTP